MTATIRYMSEGDAQRLTERIKLTIESVDNSLIKLRNLIEEAQSSNTWQVLGFASWTAYVAGLFEGRDVRLQRQDRAELTAFLSEQGMSTRAIAPVVGASAETVRRDLAGATNVAPGPAPVEKPRVVTGVDGKAYAATPKARRRRAITEQARDAMWDVLRTAERLERILQDDRFDANSAAIDDLVSGPAHRVTELVTHFRRGLSIGRVAAISEAKSHHVGVTVAINTIAELVDIETITPDQAVAALAHVEAVARTLRERAGR